MGFSGLQLCMGCSLHILPPLIPSALLQLPAEEVDVHATIGQVLGNEAKAKDTLLTSKITQAFWANKNRGEEDVCKIGDQVMLSTLHRWHEYKSGDKDHIAKFFPQFNGPHTVIAAFLPTL